MTTARISAAFGPNHGSYRWVGPTSTLQHTATHCNTLQHTATHCNTLQHTAAHCSTLQHTATQCNTLIVEWNQQTTSNIQMFVNIWIQSFSTNGPQCCNISDPTTEKIHYKHNHRQLRYQAFNIQTQNQQKNRAAQSSSQYINPHPRWLFFLGEFRIHAPKKLQSVGYSSFFFLRGTTVG